MKHIDKLALCLEKALKKEVYGYGNEGAYA